MYVVAPNMHMCVWMSLPVSECSGMRVLHRSDVDPDTQRQPPPPREETLPRSLTAKTLRGALVQKEGDGGKGERKERETEREREREQHHRGGERETRDHTWEIQFTGRVVLPAQGHGIDGSISRLLKGVIGRVEKRHGLPGSECAPHPRGIQLLDAAIVLGVARVGLKNEHSERGDTKSVESCKTRRLVCKNTVLTH